MLGLVGFCGAGDATRTTPQCEGRIIPVGEIAGLGAVLDNAGIGVWEYRALEGRIRWGGLLTRLLGRSAEAPDGGLAMLFRRADPRDAQAVAAFLAAPDGEDGARIEHRHALADGSRRWLRTSRSSVERDALGRVTRICGCTEDVTDLREALQRAAAAETRLREAVEALPFGFVIYGPDDRLVLCNQPYRDLGPLSVPAIFPGARIEDILRCGLAAGEYLEANGREEAWLAQRLAQHAAGDNDFEQLREGGRWIRSIARRTANGDHVGLRLDITDQKRAIDLERSRAEADAASAAKTQFLARMSHEMRTPLNGVLGMTELIARRIHDPELLGMLGIVRESGRLLVSLIDDILDVSKIEAGMMRLERLPLCPLAIVEQVVAAHTPSAEAKGLGLRMDISQGAEGARLGDPHRLAQVLHNLIGNAIKFTATGAVAVGVGSEGDDVVLRISDSGIGMTQQQAEQVFDAFTQADDTVTRRFGGTGLGLTIVKGIVEAMGGRITLQTAPGQGASFTVRLPLPPAQ